MITGMIAACLYGNIGLKVAYINVVEDILKGPPLKAKKAAAEVPQAAPVPRLRKTQFLRALPLTEE